MLPKILQKVEFNFWQNIHTLEGLEVELGGAGRLEH